MTPKLYQALKEARLKTVSPIVRTHINTFFLWLKSIRPEEVVDAIDKGITAEQAYKNLGLNPFRFGIAAARGFLKTPQAAKYRDQLKQIVTYDLTITTLKFENPNTYAVIQGYGDRGKQFLETWMHGALKILGVNKN